MLLGLLFCFALSTPLPAQEPKAPDTPQDAPPASQATSEAPEYTVDHDPTAGGPEHDPDWLGKALAREADLLPVIPIASQSRSFESAAPAILIGGPEPLDDGEFFQLSAGSQSPIECWVLPEDKDLASLLQQVSASNFGQMGGEQQTLEAKAVERIRSGSYGRHPHLGVDWLYRVSTPQGDLAGFLKLRAATVTGTTLFCQHNELGYRGTFERVFESLVRNLVSRAPAPPEPYYLEIVEVRIAGRPLGYTETWFTHDADGDTRIDERSALLLPIEGQGLTAQDTSMIQFSTPDGTLINEVELEAENGNLVTNISLSPHEEGWRADGLAQGQKVGIDLPPRFLTSALGEVLRLRHLVSGVSSSPAVTLSTWEAGLSPGAFVDTEFRRAETDGETGAEGDAANTGDGHPVRVQIGDAVLQGTASSGGHFTQLSMTLGANPVEMRRIYHQGEVPGSSPATDASTN